MSTSVLPPVVFAPDPVPRRYSRDEYYQMLDWGLFHDQHVELIDGEVMQMAAQRNLHVAGVTLAADAARGAFGPGFWVRVQSSLDLSPFSVPDPDVAVVQGHPKACAVTNPTTALLVVEVSDTTLRYDSGAKASLYARSGIADYWIVNVVDRWLEVRRNPQPSSNQRFDFAYADVIRLQPAEYATPLAAPHAQILVEDLLP